MTPEEMILSEIKDRFKVQLSQIDILDTKASILLSTDAIILGALFAAVLANVPRDRIVVIFLMIGAVFILASFLVSLLNYRVTQYNCPPEPTPLIDKYFHLPVDETRGVLAASLAVAFKQNDRKTRDKAMWLTRAILLLFCGIILIAVGFGTFLLRN